MPGLPVVGQLWANRGRRDRERRLIPELRLVKVLVQPVFALDHGDRIEEKQHGTVAIPAEEWPSHSGERFSREVKAWQKRIDAEDAPGRPGKARAGVASL